MAKRPQRGTALALVPLVLALVVSLAPTSAWAYFNRGSVGVSVGVAALTLSAGETADVTVSLTPASDDQTEGCGMPKCPQSCASTCTDELGQCRCAGADLTTYYPSAKAVSSNSNVAMAVCDAGQVRVYGRSEGTATITVVGSLRQFNDGEATIEVKVEGGDAAAAESAAPAEFSAMPETADLSIDDRQDYVEKTAMGRPICFVRIGGSEQPGAVLASLAGVDGEATFWEGDTLHQPDYSVTILGTDCSEQDARRLGGLSTDNFALQVTTIAEGPLMQSLTGLDEFVVVGFAEDAVLPCAATVYAKAQGAIADEAAVALYRYDEAAKQFERADASAEVVGGYVKFQTAEPGQYVVSTHDLTAEANRAVSAGVGASDDAGASAVNVGGVVAAAAAAVVVAAAAVALVRRSKRKGRS